MVTKGESRPAAPLELLFEPEGLPGYPLPEELARLYPGRLGFEAPTVFANFVATVDGVVAMPGEPGWSSAMVGGATGTDRFVMALLRACAGALLVGATTFRASRATRWTGEWLYPDAAAPFSSLRAALGLGAGPELAVLTASGDLDPSHPALEEGALVLTTGSGAARLGGRLPAASTVVALGDGPPGPGAAVDFLRARGHGQVLTEGGPTILGALLADGHLDELFLTVSPLLAGRSGPGERLGLVERAALLPGRSVTTTLLGIRRDGPYLFLRYGIDGHRA